MDLCYLICVVSVVPYKVKEEETRGHIVPPHDSGSHATLIHTRVYKYIRRT
jgi:hypothetical protein